MAYEQRVFERRLKDLRYETDDERDGLSAAGRWKDASIDTDAAGYRSAKVFQRWTERWCRQPAALWFALIGAVDRPRETHFIIGSGLAWRAAASGEFTCVANDLRWFYFNNSGGIVLRVEPVGAS